MIRRKRANKGITQKQLAKYVRLSESYVNKLEKGKFSNVSIEVILNLSLILDIDEVELFHFFMEQFKKERIDKHGF